MEQKLELILEEEGLAELKNFQQAADILMNRKVLYFLIPATAGRLMMAEGYLKAEELCLQA